MRALVGQVIQVAAADKHSVDRAACSMCRQYSAVGAGTVHNQALCIMIDPGPAGSAQQHDTTSWSIALACSACRGDTFLLPSGVICCCCSCFPAAAGTKPGGLGCWAQHQRILAYADINCPDDFENTVSAGTLSAMK